MGFQLLLYDQEQEKEEIAVLFSITFNLQPARITDCMLLLT